MGCPPRLVRRLSWDVVLDRVSSLFFSTIVTID